MNASKMISSDDSYKNELLSLIDTASFNRKTIFFDPKDVAGLVQAADAYNAKERNIDEPLKDTSISAANIDIPPIIYIKHENLRGKPFISLQKWEGVVTEVKKASFCAKLVDVNYLIDEVAEISKDEVLPEDLDFVKPGAVFYWSIGYSDPYGVRVRSSIILFKRLPRTSAKQIQEADDNAMEVRKLLGLD